MDEDDEVFFRGGLLGAGFDSFKQPLYRIRLNLPPFLGRLRIFCFCFLLSANEKYHSKMM